MTTSLLLLGNPVLQLALLAPQSALDGADPVVGGKCHPKVLPKPRSSVPPQRRFATRFAETSAL